MSIEAISLRYGVKIIGSPVSIINENYKSELGIDEELNVINVLIVGIEDEEAYSSADAVSSASIRNDSDSLTTIIK